MTEDTPEDEESSDQNDAPREAPDVSIEDLDPAMVRAIGYGIVGMGYAMDDAMDSATTYISRGFLELTESSVLDMGSVESMIGAGNPPDVFVGGDDDDEEGDDGPE